MLDGPETMKVFSLQSAFGFVLSGDDAILFFFGERSTFEVAAGAAIIAADGIVFATIKSAPSE